MAETGGLSSSVGSGESFLGGQGQPGDDWREAREGSSVGGERPDLAVQGQSPYFEDPENPDGSDEYPRANDGQGGQDFYDHYRGGYSQ